MERIDTDIVLYLQEDYFFKSSVDNAIVEDYVRLMIDNPEIKCIHLTDQACIADKDSSFAGLKVVNRKQRYRVSCQAAIWRKEELYSLIRDYESAWEFEEFGSKRSYVMNHLYLCVDPQVVRLDINEIIPYVFTGVIQGCWYDPVVDLFRENDIVVDFSKRGMLSQKKKKPFSSRVKYRVERMVYSVYSFFSCLSLKYSSREKDS